MTWVSEEQERTVEVRFKVKLFGKPHQVDHTMQSIEKALTTWGLDPFDLKYEVEG